MSTEMKNKAEFDLAVIGAGPGGYEAAAFAAKNGLKTVLIEKNALGGTCLNNGCIPTKTLLHTADLYHKVKIQSEQIGLKYTDFTYDMARMQQRRREVIASLQDGIAKLMKSHKVTVVRGTAKIVDEHEIAVSDGASVSVISAAKILMTAGSVPAVPPIDGVQYTITSNELLSCDTAYDSLIIIGGGVIGIEFASLYTSLGKKVVIIEAMERILPNMDREFAQSVKMLLKKHGADIKAKTTVNNITRDESGRITCHYTEKGQDGSISADAVLMAVGRRPYCRDLWADNVAIQTEKDAVKVNENYQTDCPNIYAAGDVIGGVQLAHMASAEAINAVCHMLDRPFKYDTKLIPSCIYTSPEIASVGMTADEAKQMGKKVLAVKYPMGANGKSLLSMQERGFIKLIADSETRCLLGAQLMCARATDMISQFTEAISNRLTLDDLEKIIYPHPTFNEGVSKALE